MNRYYLVVSRAGDTAILKMPEWTFISAVSENPEYQEYFAWVAEGNTAEEWNPQG